MPGTICLNTSTLRGHRLELVAEMELAAAAGFGGIEPWMSEVDTYLRAGGTLSELRRRAEDLGLRFCCAIDFPEWLVDDDTRRKAGLEAARRSMGALAELGCPSIAAAPMSVDAPVALEVAVQRYRALLAIGDELGVVPLVEFWGKSPAIHLLSEAVAIARGAGSPHAAILADVYHMYKGGTEPAELARLEGRLIGCFHVNDYPASPPRSTIEDCDRVFPGDGVAPLDDIARTLQEIRYSGPLSLELFNESYWTRPAEEVVREGYEKTTRAFGLAT